MLKIKVRDTAYTDHDTAPRNLAGHVGGQGGKDQSENGLAFFSCHSVDFVIGGSTQDACECSLPSLNMSKLITYTKGSSFATGLEVQDKRKRVLTISTGSKSVDTILGGM